MLEEAMYKRGINVKELSERTGIKYTTLYRMVYDNKVENMRLATILRICLAMKCKIEDIVDDEELIDLIKQYEHDIPNS